MKFIKLTKKELIAVLNDMADEITNEFLTIVNVEEKKAQHVIKMKLLRDSLHTLNNFARKVSMGEGINIDENIDKGDKTWN